MKNFQLFITRHYDAIKLLLLTICVALLGYIILTNMAENQAADERRSEAIAQAVKQINDKADEQTVQLNRQLQALCFIIVTTAGEDALKQIDPPLEEQCKDLAKGAKQCKPSQPAPVFYQPQYVEEPVEPQAPQSPQEAPQSPRETPRQRPARNLLDNITSLIR